MRRFKNILLVLDEVHSAGISIQRAVELAAVNRAKLTVLDVIPVSSFGMGLRSFSENIEMVQQQLVAERKKELSEALFGYLGDREVEITVLTGKPFIEIILHVINNGCDLVIKSAESEKLFSSLVFGSTDLKLLRKCPCPVWIVKPEDHIPCQKILAAIELDTEDESFSVDQLDQQIYEIASSLASKESAELHLINCQVVFDGGKLAQKLSKHFQKDASEWVMEQRANIASVQNVFKESFEKHLRNRGMNDLRYHYHFVEGEAEKQIIDCVRKEAIDLVVMGTVGRSQLAGLLFGNTSEAVLNQIDCSVLAVKPSGFVSPVGQREL